MLVSMNVNKIILRKLPSKKKKVKHTLTPAHPKKHLLGYK